MAKAMMHPRYLEQMKVNSVLFQPLTKEGRFAKRGRRDYSLQIIEKYRRTTPDVPPYWVEYPSRKIIGESSVLAPYMNRLMDEYDKEKKFYVVFALNNKGKGVLFTNRGSNGYITRRREKWA